MIIFNVNIIVVSKQRTSLKYKKIFIRSIFLKNAHIRYILQLYCICILYITG